MERRAGGARARAPSAMAGHRQNGPSSLAGLRGAQLAGGSSRRREAPRRISRCGSSEWLRRIPEPPHTRMRSLVKAVERAKGQAASKTRIGELFSPIWSNACRRSDLNHTRFRTAARCARPEGLTEMVEVRLIWKRWRLGLLYTGTRSPLTPLALSNVRHRPGS
jgi:hypothetical protein